MVSYLRARAMPRPRTAGEVPVKAVHGNPRTGGDSIADRPAMAAPPRELPLPAAANLAAAAGIVDAKLVLELLAHHRYDGLATLALQPRFGDFDQVLVT